MQLDRPFATVTPTADGDVLTALARVDSALSVSQLRRVIARYSGEGLRKVLARLVEQGTVHAEYAGNGVAYRLNREHLATEAIVAIADAKPRLLSRLEEAFESWPPVVRYAALFGSAARGEMRPDSDIDVVMIHEDGGDHSMWERPVARLERDVHSWTGNSLSLISMSVAELRRRRNDPLIIAMRREGLTVSGSRSWFEDQLRRAGGRADA